MQLGQPVQSPRFFVRLAFASVLVALGSSTAGGDFRAFTWAQNHPATTPRVAPMVQVDPWCSLEDVAQRLRDLPEGRRFVVFSWMSDDLCENPADRCIERVWEVRTRWVVPTASGGQAAAGAVSTPSGPTLASAGRAAVLAPAKQSKSGIVQASPSLAVSRSSAPVAVTERVQVDRLTSHRGPWLDNGIRVVRARVAAAMRRLKELGAPIDGVAVDNEKTLHAAHFLQADGALRAVQADPRWPALARSMGLPVEVTGMAWGNDLYFRWTERMAGRFDAAMNAAVFEPIRAEYPNAAVSNFCANRISAAFASPDVNGHFDRRHSAGFGTHDNHEFYGWMGPLKIARISGADWVDPAWVAFRAEVHRIRGMNASSKRPKNAWIAARSWRGEAWGPVEGAGTPMWDELVLQLGVHGVRQFLEFSPDAWWMDAAANRAQRAADRAVLDGLLAELDARIGSGEGNALTARQPSWNDRVIATGRIVGDQVIWRFSFAEGVKGVTVTMDDGRTVYLSPDEGRCGTWFTHGIESSVRTSVTGGPPLMALHLEDEP